jgi:subtilisin family serine protease
MSETDLGLEDTPGRLLCRCSIIMESSNPSGNIHPCSAVRDEPTYGTQPSEGLFRLIALQSPAPAATSSATFGFACRRCTEMIRKGSKMIRVSKGGREPGLELLVHVVNLKGEAIERAFVTLTEQSETARARDMSWNPVRQRYIVNELPPGRYALQVEADPGSLLEPQTRNLELARSTQDELFVLGASGLPAFYRGAVRVPFRPLPNLIAVQLTAQPSALGQDQLQAVSHDLQLQEQKVPPAAVSAGVLVFRAPNPEITAIHAILRRLQELPAVLRAGAVVLFGDETLSFLSGQFSVRFRRALTRGEVQIFAERRGFALRRKLTYAVDTWVFAHPEAGPSYQLLEGLEKTAQEPDVQWAEPELITPAPIDAVVPTDFLWPGQWDHKLVGCPDAWQALKDAGIPAYGDPALILAIIDQGIQSENGVPVHPDFQGVVSDGQPKVAKLFHFGTMAANNDPPLEGNHGMSAAGIALANADNPAPVGTGAFGIAGAAPNVRAMGLIPPLGDIEIRDMYLWAAGFQPESPSPNFPLPLEPGHEAAVLTTSLGLGCGAPIPQVAADMLDFITASGRAGKGCLCFFSAGNNNLEFTLARPYAAYHASLGITASTLGEDGISELKAGYSCWGNHARLCAPSSDGSVGSIEFHNPPQRLATWGAALSPKAQVISNPDFEAALETPAVAGAPALELTTTLGLAHNDRLMIGRPGTPGQEPATIDSIDVLGSSVALKGVLLNNHSIGTPVYRGPAFHQWFGGTSSATPLCAGVAALVLSANPALSWTEVRDILQTTAVKIDKANIDPIGKWLDADGNACAESGEPPVFSKWYGFGRVDAAAAVTAALGLRLPA